MGATNTTTNYSLSQFVATDKPAWLQDYNGDMLKIDTAIKAAKTAADSAQSTADTASSGVSTNTSAITSLQTTVGGLNTSVTNLQSSVNTIQSLIGNGTPTTTDHTIIGAINEINAYLHLRKIGRSDLSLATTRKAAWDTIYTLLAGNLTQHTEGVIKFSDGTLWNFNGSTSEGWFVGSRIFTPSGAYSGIMSANIANGTSSQSSSRFHAAGTTITDDSSNSNATTWADVYIYE